MPVYEYGCSACGQRTDILHGINDLIPTFCPACGAEGTLRKTFAPPAIVFKGSGWAKKDRSTAARSRARSDSDASSDNGATGKGGADDKGSADRADGDKGSADRADGDKGADKRGSDAASGAGEKGRSDRGDASASPGPKTSSGSPSGSGSSGGD